MAINPVSIITNRALPKDVAAAILKKLGPGGLRILAKVDKRLQEIILELLPRIFQKAPNMNIPSRREWLMNQIHTLNDLIKFVEFNGKRRRGMIISGKNDENLIITPIDRKVRVIRIMADAEVFSRGSYINRNFEGSYWVYGDNIKISGDLVDTINRLSRDQACCIL